MKREKIALVTGGARGIGQACCYELSERGYKVLLHYRSSQEEAFKTASKISDCHLYSYDLSETSAPIELIKQVKKDHGRLDVLVNNAGKTLNKLFVRSKEEDFDDLLSSNLKPLFLLTKSAARLMILQKSGSIINLSSVVAFTGNQGQALYSSVKGAVTSLTRSSALELGPFGVRINSVAPGFIETKMTESLSESKKVEILKKIPLGRFGSPTDVAQLVGFLASDQSSYITGSTFHVNGGLFGS